MRDKTFVKKKTESNGSMSVIINDCGKDIEFIDIMKPYNLSKVELEFKINKKTIKYEFIFNGITNKFYSCTGEEIYQKDIFNDIPENKNLDIAIRSTSHVTTCMTCKGTGSLQNLGFASVKACSTCKGKGFMIEPNLNNDLDIIRVSRSIVMPIASKLGLSVKDSLMIQGLFSVTEDVIVDMINNPGKKDSTQALGSIKPEQKDMEVSNLYEGGDNDRQ